MSKKPHERRLKETEAQAVGQMIRTSARKLELVAGLIRGKKVETALADLAFSKRRMARDVRRVLQSAIANAENNHQLDVDRLVVSEASVGKALVMRRFHARGRGRGAPVRKPFSRILIVVGERAEEKKADKPAAKAEKNKTSKAKAPKAAADKNTGKEKA